MTVILRRLLNCVPGVRQARLQWVGIRPLVYHRLAGCPVPPPHEVKLYWLGHFQASYGLETLVETGTYQGTTVAAMVHRFERVYTIEVDHTLWRRAHDRFSKYPHVQVIQGDSADILPAILVRISDRCLFWLDGHFSGAETARGRKDTPIVEELAAIRSHCRKDHVVLIDDARLFCGANGYPALDTVTSMLRDINPKYMVRVVDDIIQAYLPKSRAFKFRTEGSSDGALFATQHRP